MTKEMNAPEWLRQIAEKQEFPNSFPIEDILRNSCYYPASGIEDRTPIQQFQKLCCSFVYCDLSTDYERYKKHESELFPRMTKIMEKDIQLQDILRSSFVPIAPENPEDRELIAESINTWQSIPQSELFAKWSIWKIENSDQLISFVFFRGEASAIYQALYLENKIQPKIIVNVRDGFGSFGCGFYPVGDMNRYFWQCVKMQNTLPEYIIDDGDYDNDFSDYQLVRETITQSFKDRVCIYRHKSQMFRFWNDNYCRKK